MSKNVLQTIRSRTDSFSRGQKRIADYILMNYDKAAFMTAGHLGRKAQVSESTVVRFASQLGYDGYPNMQRALQELVRGKLTSLQRIQVSRDQMQEQDVLTGVMQRDIDYVVKDGQVIIVDEFTGRLMFGRRYSNGLHQAIEAKEHVSVQRESKTLATITFQNYFRLYSKLSGMTGTAMTEEEEFATIYKLDIVEIPTNRPVVRIDNEDAVYKTEQGKYRAVIRQVKECHEKGQPVLVGTVSIEKNELLSRMLTKEGIRHNLLNAKNHEKEAEIVAQAGQFGAVTVATNMAGRGTDIILGGNAEYMATNDLRKAGYTDKVIADATGYAETDNSEILEARQMFADKLRQHKEEISGEADRVRQAGGLFIIGTERHESRRIDNQLRGRAGRQGDPGESRFYLSLEDDIMRLFGLGKTQVRRFALTHGVRTKRIHGNRLYYLKADWDAARKIAERKSASTKAKREQENESDNN